MKVRAVAVVVSVVVGALSPFARAQSPQTLTLEQARALAMQNQPVIREARFNTQRVSQTIREARSAYFPAAVINLTGVDALKNSSLAAGALNNSTISDRYSNGGAIGQLITDFGRTGNLVKTAKYRLSAAHAGEEAVVEDAALRVTQAYFQALQSQALLKVAEETVKARKAVADQVSALAKHQLKSGLDLSFANVNLAQARLLESAAANDVESSQAELSAAMGFATLRTFQLIEPPLPAPPLEDISNLISQAYARRPEMARERSALQAAQSFARAERDLALPTLSSAAVAGETPVRQSSVASHYAAAGFNVSIPIFNGHLFSARRAEAQLQAQAQSEALQALQVQIARDVRTAWLRAKTAYDRLSLTQQLLEQAKLSLNLAAARYQLGLSSIVELTQAQLNYTEAEIQQTSALYEYQIDSARLQYETGNL